MKTTLNLGRRAFLKSTGAAGLVLAGSSVGMLASGPAWAQGKQIRIASNPGLENATLNALIASKGYLEEFGVTAEIVEVNGASGPFKAIAAGEADVCMVSGYSGVLPSIEKGAAVKIVGAGMRAAAHIVYTNNDGIKAVEDLVGKKVGVGAMGGLLHGLMIALLNEKGIDPKSVQFEDKGSNAEVYKSVVEGAVDAGLASISNLGSQERDNVRALDDSKIWEQVPDYTFQTAYASDTAIAERRDALVGTLAAYGKLYAFLMGPDSRDDFFAARKSAQKNFDEASAEAAWRFIQEAQPYTANLAVTEEQIAHLQDLFVEIGTQSTAMPYDKVADRSIADAAFALIG